jgi:translation initiation factor 1
MSKKSKPDVHGFVFSTDPAFNYEKEQQEEAETLTPDRQKLRLTLDKKQRAGKAVTLVLDFIGKNEDLEDLGKKLKNFCGTGGSVKDGEIIIQGDQRQKVLPWLQKNGYTKTRM